VRRGAPFDSALEKGLGALPEVDRRLTHELAAGVLRQEASLDALLAPFVPRGLASVHPLVLDILRIGAYQLHHLERVPAHAAVTISVALAREAQGDRITGFVNAVLRKVAGVPRNRDANPAHGDLERLASSWSHPAWLVARWIERFGVDDTEALLEWNNTHPALVVQPARGTLDALQERFATAGVRSFPAPHGAGLVVEETRPERLPGFADGEFYVQDPAQAMVMRFAGFPPASTVYDACAAPGGKTLGMARTAAHVVAADASRRRLARLRDNIARAGHGNEYPVVADALHPPVRDAHAFLLDAPCLGTGTFARHPDARLRVRPEALHRLVREQADLLDAAANRIATGGVLCYATCSLEPEEDEAQVTAFLSRHPEFRREPPAGFPQELLTPVGDLLVLPHRDGMDGAFAARMVRQ
jgi:16S rRNA (cytosine967-C5)-methyltransferase